MSKEIGFCHLFNMVILKDRMLIQSMIRWKSGYVSSTVGRGSFSALEFKHTQRRGESTLCVSAFSIKVVTNEGMSHSKTDG